LIDKDAKVYKSYSLGYKTELLEDYIEKLLGEKIKG